MIINQTIGFTFIHIPKSAGTSVTSYLSPLNSAFDLEIGGTDFGEEIQPAYNRRYKLSKHSKLSELQEIIKLASPKGEMFVFSIVRNPYARLSSIFSFLRKWESYNPELLNLMKSFKDFEDFVASRVFEQLPGPDRMFRPQVEWLQVSGEVPDNVNIYKVEELSCGLKQLRAELLVRGANVVLLPNEIPHANKSHSLSLENLNLSSQSIKKIREFYSEDFEKFEYPELA